MQAAKALVRVLRESGVSHIFGLPGDTSMDLYDALLDAHDEITHVMTRDERSASFMADVYARVSGRLGVCEGPSGGGATYIVPGVAEAQGSAIPLLCLTTDTPVSQQGRGVLTELDQESLFRPLTKWNARVNAASGVADMTRRAIRMATSGRPGAVHLSLPSDTLQGDTPGEEIYGIPAFGRVPAVRTRPDPAAICEAAALLESAARPVIVAGGGIHTSGAWSELTGLAAALNIPVATSINGKGAIDERHPCSLGVVGGNGAREYANRALAGADLVFFIGTRTDSTTTCNWTLPARYDGPTTIHLDMENRELGNNYPLAVALAGDAKLGLADVLQAIDRPQLIRARNQSRIDALLVERETYWEEFHHQAASCAYPVKPQRVVQVMRELLDDTTLIVADPGTPTPYLAAYFEVRGAGRSTVIPRAHGGLGYAIPGVVGAAMAAPDRRVIGMTTDGSFGMSAGELETIRRLNLPVVLIHCSNGSFGWIKELQHLYHADRYYSVDFSTVDYASIARGFGLQSRQILDPEQIRPALAEALADGRPWFIDIVTESQITETPPVAAWREAEAHSRLATVAS
ncbi:MAG: thiamine pyrophosphate-binding protein [Chloroflexia bacterium]|nr:thiamine pyrophosphate-binding protein [Chloroflexia bacterium]